MILVKKSINDNPTPDWLRSNFLHQYRLFHSKDDLKNTLSESKTETLEILKPPSNFYYDKVSDLFTIEFTVCEIEKTIDEKEEVETIRGDIYTKEFEVLPYALSHLSRALRINDITQFMKVMTEMDILLKYPYDSSENYIKKRKKMGIKTHLSVLRQKIYEYNFNKFKNLPLDQKENTKMILEILKNFWYVFRELSTSIKPLVANQTTDIFGTQIRSFVSNTFPYLDNLYVVNDMDKIITEEFEMEFLDAFLFPVSFFARYIMKDIILVKGIPHKTGLIFGNSNDKFNSFWCADLIRDEKNKIVLWSSMRGDTYFSQKHSNDQKTFMKRIQNGLNKIFDHQIDYLEEYKQITRKKYSRKIIENWNEIRSFPLEIKSKKVVERLAEIGESEGYSCDLWGILKTLNYYATNEATSDTEIQKFNEKANKILLNKDRLALWAPKRDKKEE